MIKVMLIGKDEYVLDDLSEMIVDEELAVVSAGGIGSAALDRVESLNPDIILIHAIEGDVDALNFCERINQYKPRTFLIMLVDELTLDTVQAANSVGVHNIIDMPNDAAALCNYIQMVYKTESGRIEALGENQSVKWTSRVITVYGTKGGLGRTSLAVNLATKLAQQRKKVALIDLDLQFGDVASYLDIEPKETVAELMQENNLNGIDAVRTYMSVHPSGVHVLCAPKSPEYADVVSADRIQALMGTLKTYYDFVIVDASDRMDDVTITAMESSSVILLVTGLDVALLKSAKTAVSILESLNQKEKLRIVLNRYVEMNTISMDDVARILTAPIIARIPSQIITATSAINKGQPFVIGEPRSKLSAAVADVAKLMEAETITFDIQELSSKEKKKYFNRLKTKEKDEKKRLQK